MAQVHKQSSYLPGYKKSHIQHHAWRTAENSAAYLIPALQSIAAAANGRIQLLDIGAGPGSISASLAQYIPDGHVVASDISEDVLTQAADHAARVGVTNISFQTADVYALPFPDDSFEVVHASMVLSHLNAPVEAYREMLRVVKPGGVVANRESDIRMWSFYPELPGLEKTRQLQLATLASDRANPPAAPRLVHWALEAGANRDNCHMSFGTWCYSTVEERRVWGGMLIARLREGVLRKKALETGEFSEQDLDEMAAGWEQWQETEDATLGCMHGEILIYK